MKKYLKDFDLLSGFNLLAILLIIIGLGYTLYLFATKEKQDNVIISRNDYFSLTIPSKYSFINNSIASSDKDNLYELAIYDKKNNFYVFGNIYDLTDEDGNTLTLEEYVQDDFDYFSTQEGIEVKNKTIEKIEIKEFDAYTYSITYTSNEDNKNYYHMNIWINGNKGIYLLEFECFEDKINNYYDDILIIARTFVEI